MYAYLEGALTQKTPAFVVVDIGGIGYRVHISLNTWGRIQDLDRCRLFTHLNVKEDAHTLYGFATERERDLFVTMIGVSGIGPNTARMVLSTLEPQDLEMAIATENESAIRAVKGIGPKSAKRMILELKDKVGKVAAISGGIAVNQHNTITEEALSALTMLGFSRQVAEKAVTKVCREQPDVNTLEQLIKLSLKHM